MRARIRKWHFGKLIIVGIWFMFLSVGMLRDFAALSAREHPYRCLIELSLPVLLLLLLSTMVWIWLGGKEEDDING